MAVPSVLEGQQRVCWFAGEVGMLSPALCGGRGEWMALRVRTSVRVGHGGGVIRPPSSSWPRRRWLDKLTFLTCLVLC